MIYDPAMLGNPTLSRDGSKSTYNKITFYHKLIWKRNKTHNRNKFNIVLKHEKYTQVLTLKWIKSTHTVSTSYKTISLSTEEKKHEEAHSLSHMTTNHPYFNTKYFVQNPLAWVFTYNINIYTYEKENQNMKTILRQHDNNW